MIRPRGNPLLIASLLALAALVCLGAGLSLLANAGRSGLPGDSGTPLVLVSRLALVGGFVVFLLGTIALLVARRLAFGSPQVDPSALPDPLALVDVQDWGRELADIRDRMRQDLGADPVNTVIDHRELVIPGGWRPAAEYLLQPHGQATDPLADLKRTRNQLMEAAERVDTIVQNIHEITSSNSKAIGYKQSIWHGLWRRCHRRP